jgi:flagellar protein FlbD
VIIVTRFDGTEYVLNAELIVKVEATPDTVISLVNGDTLIVRESRDEVVARILEYRRSLSAPLVAAAER